MQRIFTYTLIFLLSSTFMAIGQNLTVEAVVGNQQWSNSQIHFCWKQRYRKYDGN